MNRAMAWWGDMTGSKRDQLLDKYDLDLVLDPSVVHGIFVMECKHDFGRSYGRVTVCRDCGISMVIERRKRLTG